MTLRTPKKYSETQHNSKAKQINQKFSKMRINILCPDELSEVVAPILSEIIFHIIFHPVPIGKDL